MFNNKNVLIMKKLGKITINPEKVIKNEELKSIKGGWIEVQCYCYQTMEHFGLWVEDWFEAADLISQHCEYGGHCEEC
jgi:hypothetical protein